MPARHPLAALLRVLLRARVRGSTRATFLLARHLRSLQAVPVTVNGRQVIFVDLRDGLAHRLLAGSPWAGVPWEPDEQAVMRRVVAQGDAVVDVGAHIGLHTVLLAELVGGAGCVHAFEANSALLPALAETARRAGNVTVHPLALADSPGRRTFFVPDDRSMASLADWTEARVGRVQVTTCDVGTLDELTASGRTPVPDFLKCDVEGAETLVFRGARRTLDRRDAALVLYEANERSARAFGNDIGDATVLLRALPAAGYRIFHVQPGGTLVPLPAFRSDCDHYNLLAVPASKLDRLSASGSS